MNRHQNAVKYQNACLGSFSHKIESRQLQIFQPPFCQSTNTHRIHEHRESSQVLNPSGH